MEVVESCRASEQISTCRWGVAGSKAQVSETGSIFTQSQRPSASCAASRSRDAKHESTYHPPAPCQDPGRHCADAPRSTPHACTQQPLSPGQLPRTLGTCQEVSSLPRVSRQAPCLSGCMEGFGALRSWLRVSRMHRRVWRTASKNAFKRYVGKPR